MTNFDDDDINIRHDNPDEDYDHILDDGCRMAWYRRGECRAKSDLSASASDNKGQGKANPPAPKLCAWCDTELIKHQTHCADGTIEEWDNYCPSCQREIDAYDYEFAKLVDPEDMEA
jgi:hypothetical protein